MEEQQAKDWTDADWRLLEHQVTAVAELVAPLARKAENPDLLDEYAQTTRSMMVKLRQYGVSFDEFWESIKEQLDPENEWRNINGAIGIEDAAGLALADKVNDELKEKLGVEFPFGLGSTGDGELSLELQCDKKAFESVLQNLSDPAFKLSDTAVKTLKDFADIDVKAVQKLGENSEQWHNALRKTAAAIATLSDEDYDTLEFTLTEDERTTVENNTTVIDFSPAQRTTQHHFDLAKKLLKQHCSEAVAIAEFVTLDALTEEGQQIVKTALATADQLLSGKQPTVGQAQTQSPEKQAVASDKETLALYDALTSYQAGDMKARATVLKEFGCTSADIQKQLDRFEVYEDESARHLPKMLDVVLSDTCLQKVNDTIRSTLGLEYSPFSTIQENFEWDKTDLVQHFVPSSRASQDVSAALLKAPEKLLELPGIMQELILTHLDLSHSQAHEKSQDERLQTALDAAHGDWREALCALCQADGRHVMAFPGEGDTMVVEANRYLYPDPELNRLNKPVLTLTGEAAHDLAHFANALKKQAAEFNVQAESEYFQHKPDLTHIDFNARLVKDMETQLAAAKQDFVAMAELAESLAKVQAQEKTQVKGRSR